VIAKNSSLPEEGPVPPKKQKTSVAAANVGFAFLEFVAMLAAVGIGVGVGVYLDNAMASAFAAHVLAGVTVALMNELGKKLKKTR
jgi:ABC-type phosphate transport system permease subunit